MSQAHETPPKELAERPHWLDRRIDLTRVDPQIVLFLLFVAIAAVLRFSHLGVRAMHHDEAIHAWYSWRFYTGQELYRYNPVFHGPLLYHITALFYFLFGVSEAIARAPEALFGVLLVVLCYPLRRYLGRFGWLIAAGLLAISPSFVYFSRFARHDAFVATLTLAVVVFLFRYLEEQRPRDLAWAAAALALSFAAMEVTFITAFILFVFLALAYLLDWQGERRRAEARIIALVVLVAAWLLELRLVAAGEGAPAVHVTLAALALLALAYAGPSSLCARPFPRGSSPARKAVEAVKAEPRVLLGAFGIFVLVFGLFFTTFLTYPRGFVDGLVQGLQHWAAQQNVRRGDQPWFYYLLLLALYEPVTLTAGLAGAGIVVSQLRRWGSRGVEGTKEPAGLLFSAFLVHWALFALVLFSWAGEKMPWLLLHVALPLVFLAAMALDRFLAWVSWRPLWRSGDWAAGPLALLILFALRGMGNALSRMQPGAGGGLEDQYLALQAAVLGLILVAMIVALTWRVYRAEGRHLGQSFALVGFLLLALYTVRSTFLTNYYHGDTPVEMLVYTQTAPDVPWVVRQIERISIDQTRKVRTEQDPTGGHGLRVAIDTTQGLEWPFNWYLREFPLLYFDGRYGPPPDADVVLVLADNEPALRPYLQNAYTGWRYKHRWWFPEFETYKRWCLWAIGVTDLGYPTEPWLRLSTYRSEGLANLWRYLTQRKLPYALGSQDFYLYVRNELLPGAAAAAAPDPYLEKLGQRQAIAFFGSAGSGPGQLSFPRGIAVDKAGNLYVADSGNHRIVRFDPQGETSVWGSPCVLETGVGCVDPDGMGPLPLGAGQFNEPWGVAVDSEGRVYVADTWNHRIQVLDANGDFLGEWGEGQLIDVGEDITLREARPFGFYGPRGVAVDGQGKVYVTDTGNERVLVYRVQPDAAGGIRAEYLYQWGTTGSAPGQFLEPVGIAVDASGRVYVADTWNLRVQVFAPGPDGNVSPIPEAVIPVTGWESDSRENKPYIAVDSGGLIYFTVPERHYVAAVRVTGEVLTVWGGYGVDLASFHLPTGIAVDSKGQVYVSDSGNGRVLLFRLP
ncbi:MAG: flippase activity-associated protein Agl23 [Chloroflexia bacterium]